MTDNIKAVMLYSLLPMQHTKRFKPYTQSAVCKSTHKYKYWLFEGTEGEVVKI